MFTLSHGLRNRRSQTDPYWINKLNYLARQTAINCVLSNFRSFRMNGKLEAATWHSQPDKAREPAKSKRTEHHIFRKPKRTKWKSDQLTPPPSITLNCYDRTPHRLVVAQSADILPASFVDVCVSSRFSLLKSYIYCNINQYTGWLIYNTLKYKFSHKICIHNVRRRSFGCCTHAMQCRPILAHTLSAQQILMGSRRPFYIQHISLSGPLGCSTVFFSLATMFRLWSTMRKQQIYTHGMAQPCVANWEHFLVVLLLVLPSCAGFCCCPRMPRTKQLKFGSLRRIYATAWAHNVVFCKCLSLKRVTCCTCTLRHHRAQIFHRT